MRTRDAVVAAAVAFVAAGCGEDTCPTETPQVSQVADCTVRPGAAVSYPVQLCPTCNVDLSAVGAGAIFLDPKVEVCSQGNTCPPTCEAAAFACTFTAPSAEG